MTLWAHHEFVVDALFTANQEHLITIGNRDPLIRIWNLQDGRLLRELGASDAGVNAITLLRDDNTLIAADSAGVIRSWHAASGQIHYEVELDMAAILRLAIDNDESVICASSEDGRIAWLDLPTGAILHHIDAHKTAIRYLYFLNDQRQAVSIGDDRHVKVWSIETGELIHDWTGLEERPTAVLLSANENTLVVGDLNGTLLAWGLKAGEHRSYHSPAIMRKYGVLHLARMATVWPQELKRTG